MPNSKRPSKATKVAVTVPAQDPLLDLNPTVLVESLVHLNRVLLQVAQALDQADTVLGISFSEDLKSIRQRAEENLGDANDSVMDTISHLFLMAGLAQSDKHLLQSANAEKAL